MDDGADQGQARFEAIPVITGLCFGEGLRWRDGALWFSDMHARTVNRWTPSGPGATTGVTEVVAMVPGRPSGLGFLDRDTLLVASQQDRSVQAIDLREPWPATPRTFADLSGIATWHVNDLLTDEQGRTYVGNYGDATHPGVPSTPAHLALVSPSGSVAPAAAGPAELEFPNGMALLDGGETLVVAETRSVPGRLTAYRRDSQGRLSERRVLAELPGRMPDGIAVDSRSHLWVACPLSDEVIRVSPEGEVVTALPMVGPYALALGGADGLDLFVATASTWVPEDAIARRDGAIVRVRVTVQV